VICIHTVCRCRDIVTVNTELAIILVKSLQCGNIRGSFNDLVNPLDASHHLVPKFTKHPKCWMCNGKHNIMDKTPWHTFLLQWRQEALYAWLSPHHYGLQQPNNLPWPWLAAMNWHVQNVPCHNCKSKHQKRLSNAITFKVLSTIYGILPSITPHPHWSLLVTIHLESKAAGSKLIGFRFMLAGRGSHAVLSNLIKSKGDGQLDNKQNSQSAPAAVKRGTFVLSKWRTWMPNFSFFFNGFPSVQYSMQWIERDSVAHNHSDFIRGKKR